ncbi:MAG TPA: hypothetical protein VMH83_07145 [Candidatus Acidoferrum sp.]|nr:hypothetical protein [Candidatus Acidoferrum sp.]
MARMRREADAFTMSFLDIMCCGFGAVILLMLLSKSALNNTKDAALEVSDRPNAGRVLDMQKQLFALRGETNILNRDLNAKQEQLSDYDIRIARMQSELQDVQRKLQNRSTEAMSTDTEAGKLALARQSLTDEMKRLQARMQQSAKSDSIGGVPVDSEYVIFVIDTSGSMFNYAWNKLMEVVTQTLNVYPSLKGIQVLNCEGEYMFSSYRGQWIEDSPARRQAILGRLRTWNPFCRSNPVPGILTAIHEFYAPDKKISVYVMGDDFEDESSQEVLDTVNRINRAGSDGTRMVRIHGIGFPTQFSQPVRYQTTGRRFANLMRQLARQNGGTFVGLNEFY